MNYKDSCQFCEPNELRANISTNTLRNNVKINMLMMDSSKIE